MDTRDEELRHKIVNLLSDAFIVRRPVNPEDVASQLAKGVDSELAAKVTAVAKGIGVGLTAKGLAQGSARDAPEYNLLRNPDGTSVRTSMTQKSPMALGRLTWPFGLDTIDVALAVVLLAVVLALG